MKTRAHGRFGRREPPHGPGGATPEGSWIMAVEGAFSRIIRLHARGPAAVDAGRGVEE